MFGDSDAVAHYWRWEEAEGWLPGGPLSKSHRAVEVPAGTTYVAVRGPEAQVSLGLRVNPVPTIGRIFSHFEEERAVRVAAPVPGATLRAVVAHLSGSGADSLQVALADGPPWEDDPTIRTVDARREAAPVPLPQHVAVVRFTLPRDLTPGGRYLQVRRGKQATYWTPIEVADPEQVERRNVLIQEARAVLAETHGPEVARQLALVGRYRPLPEGAVLRDVTAGERTYAVEGEGAWLFYAYDRAAGFSQPHGTWLICYYPPGNNVALYPRGPAGRVGGGEGFGDGDVLTGGAFDAGGDPAPIEIDDEEAPEPGPLVSPGRREWNGFSGRLEGRPCPNGRRSAVLVLQLVQGEGDVASGVDENGDPRLRPDFDQVAEDVKGLLDQHLETGSESAPGPDRIDHLTPEDFLPAPPPSGFGRDRVRLDLDKVLVPRLEAIKAQDGGACCTDITLIILSHGSPSGSTRREHPLSYYYRDPDTGTEYKGDTGNRNRWNSTSDILEKVAEVMGTSCIPVTVIDHSCYSGRTAAHDGRKFEDALEDYPDHRITLVTASSAGETANGVTDDAGQKSIHFFDALSECLREHGDLKAALACVQRRTNERSERDRDEGGSGKGQHPLVYPPVERW